MPVKKNKTPVSKGKKVLTTSASKAVAVNSSGKKGLAKSTVPRKGKAATVKPSDRKNLTKSTSSRKEKAVAVKPSGKKDESFFEQVFEVARLIPYGRVTSYGAIAACLGTRLSARMVGWAMNSAHHNVPAHRVVNRNGMLSGKHHFPTPTRMQELLEKEGIKVKDDKVTDFKKVFWDPVSILDL